MRVELEPRPSASPALLWLMPALAVAATMAVGAAVFSALGHDGPRAVRTIFLLPLADAAMWPDLAVKAAPLVLIAAGLAVAFRANVWNIGAEGQYVMGGLAGTGVALATWGMEGWWILPAMILAGVAGGMAWAAVPAALRTRRGVSEILSSLLLTYVAVQGLNYLMRGPWKDPEGFNFPQTRLFTAAQLLPEAIPGTGVHAGVPLALAAALAVWAVMGRTVFGFRVRSAGLAPQAAAHAGFGAAGTIRATLLLSGGLAGLAGILEAAGPFGQMVPQFPTGYGFAAIIVAFLGRLHPLGVVPAGVVLAVCHVGGEAAQSSLGLPAAAAGIFQAMMLFFLLAGDGLVRCRVRIVAGAAGGRRR